MASAPQVDFYVLEKSGADPDRLVCRLTRKAYERGMDVFIRARDGEHAAKLDDLLWTFEQLSFLPHAQSAEADEDTPIVIGTDEPARAGLYINLADCVPGGLEAFGRIADVVAPEAAARNAARKRYKAYRETGAAPNTYKLERA